MVMRYHWGRAVGHLYTCTSSRRRAAPIATKPEFEGLIHKQDTIEQGADGGNGSPDKSSDEGVVPDTASDVHDRDHWDREDSEKNSEFSSDSDSQHSDTSTDTDSVLLEIDAMYGDTLDVEWTSFD